jgi:catechol 2,3-dioxygenase-like lactoylglutathione lyase family enzyme
MEPNTLDHVAFWTSDRETIVDFLTAHTDMHVIERTEKFTLVGTDARRGKLTLFDAEGPREPRPLRHVGLRVSDLAAAESRLPDGLELDRSDGRVAFDVSEGLRLALVEAPTDVEYDLDHVALFSAAPEETAEQYLQLGFESASPGPSGAPRVEVGGAWVEFHHGDASEPEKPLLNHLAVLVDSADEHRSEAEELGVEVADFVDAPNTLAVFLWGPERVKIEYVEHKPSFSLT